MLQGNTNKPIWNFMLLAIIEWTTPVGYPIHSLNSYKAWHTAYCSLWINVNIFQQIEYFLFFLYKERSLNVSTMWENLRKYCISFRLIFFIFFFFLFLLLIFEDCFLFIYIYISRRREMGKATRIFAHYFFQIKLYTQLHFFFFLFKREVFRCYCCSSSVLFQVNSAQ